MNFLKTSVRARASSIYGDGVGATLCIDCHYCGHRCTISKAPACSSFDNELLKRWKSRIAAYIREISPEYNRFGFRAEAREETEAKQKAIAEAVAALADAKLNAGGSTRPSLAPRSLPLALALALALALSALINWDGVESKTLGFFIPVRLLRVGRHG